MKIRIMKLIEWLAYWSGLDALFYWLNRRYPRVVCFHNVLPDALMVGGVAGGFSFSESDFRSIVRQIKGRAILSFDDGYLNQFEVVGRILREEGTVGMLFVSKRLIDSPDPASALVVDQIIHWLGFVPNGDYKIPYCDRIVELHLHDDLQRYDAFVKVLNPIFFADAETKGEKLISALDEVYPMHKIFAAMPSEYRRLRLTGISTKQLEMLKQEGWVVGYHTDSHFPLKSLSTAEKHREIEGGKTLGCTVFAYPYGSPDAVDDECIAIAHESYDRAYSFMEDPGKTNGTHFLPRMMVTSSDKYTLNFELSGLKHFLKTRRLLPRRSS